MGAIMVIVLASLATAIVATLVGWAVNQLPSLKAQVSARVRVWLAIGVTAIAGLVATGISISGSATGRASAGASRGATAQTGLRTGTPPAAVNPTTSPVPDILASASTESAATDAPSRGFSRPASIDGSDTAITYLYQLPANSAGQPGQQRSPFDVRLASNRYAHSTGMWTQCAGKSVPLATFHTGQKYQRLAGTLGIVDTAPSGMSVQVQIYADNGIWQWFTVNHGQVLPIDLDISRFSTIGLTASSADGCPKTDKPLVYLGDGGVL